MEPFRPLIDTVVLSLDLSEEGLTAANRDALIRWQYDTVRYDGRRYSACDAIECFVKSCLDFLNGEGDTIGEVGLYE